MNKPNPTTGMRHVALNVKDVEACEQFYVDLMGMQVEWKPDPDNVYLTSGNDKHEIIFAPTTQGEKNADGKIVHKDKTSVGWRKMDWAAVIKYLKDLGADYCKRCN